MSGTSESSSNIIDHFQQAGDPGWTAPPESGVDDPFELHAARRASQKRENIEIGEGTDTVSTTRVYTLEDMLAELVLITDGSQVAPLERPRAVLKLPDFKNATAASKHWIEGDGGKMKAIPAIKAWLEDPTRLEAEALTFRAGGSRIVPAPETGKRALNLWVPPIRRQAPDDWLQRAAPFLDHVEWLWGDHAGDFLDWLAHIEQFPGVLPHFGWVHISREHGKGRNWISSVLARVWAGYVAASLDLVSILEGGFNGRISQKILAIVDEINEGGSTSYRHAQRLRAIVTEEYRDINPKYGHQRQEYNSCRWLMFSNHTGAIPLGEDDRRFWIVSHEGAPKDVAYYARLYSQLRDPLFVASVVHFLRHRDVSEFKPGARPPMTDAKAALIAMGQSDDDMTLREISEKWPVDLITGYELTNLLEGRPALPATRHAMDKASFRKINEKVRVAGQGSQTVYAIRNYPFWSTASHQLRAQQIDQYGEQDKRKTIGREDFTL